MFPPREAAAITAVLNEAAARHLPTDILSTKIRRGAAKESDGQEVVRVAREYLFALSQARDALGEPATAQAIEAAGSAVEVGMPLSELRRFRNARPRQAYPVPLSVADRLWHLGVPAGLVQRGMLELLDGNSTDEDFLTLGVAVMAATFGGGSAESKYRLMMDSLRVARRSRTPP